MNLENIVKRAFIAGLVSLSSFFFSCEKLGIPMPKKDELKITYTIQKGDTLGNIAKVKCGDRNLWKQIASYNQSIDPNFNPDRIEIGQVIYLPDGCSTGDMPAVEPEQPKEAVPQNYPKEEGDGGRYTAVDQQEIEGDSMNCPDPEVLRDTDGVYVWATVTLYTNKYQSPFQISVPGYEHEYKISSTTPIHYKIDIIPNRCTDRYGTVESGETDEYNIDGVKGEAGPYCNDIVHTDQFGWYKNFCEMDLSVKISQSVKGKTPVNGCHQVWFEVKAKKLSVASGNYSCTGP